MPPTRYHDHRARNLTYPTAPPVDYYKVLEISPSATTVQIREAYKKAALKHHPDRVPSDSPERPARTKRFQQINDAYYTLSDATRKRDYDSSRSFFTGSSGNWEDPDASVPDGGAQGQGFQSWGNFFKNTFGSNTPAQESERAETQFHDVFEEMMREEGMAEGERASPTSKFWSFVGGMSGGAMGFIVANFPGAIAGAVAGNRLGAIRDAKGKSVYSVFQELPQADKAQLLSNLAARVFAHAVGS
jgi:DnaJ-class molecular chaperone